MKTLITFVFSLLFAVASFAQVTLTNDSLLAYYSFDNNSNNQHADRFHLSPVFNAGFVGPIYDTGKKGNGVRFNKNNALVNTAELANHLAASQNKSLSMSFWVNYSNSNGSLSTFVELYESLFLRNDNASYGVFTNDWFYANGIRFSSHYLRENTGWRHVVIVYNSQSSSLIIYIDGNQTNVINNVVGGEIQQFTDRVVIGTGTTTTNNVTSYNWATKGFVGMLDEMYIYNRVLLSSEVSDLFNMRVVPASEVSDEKLIAHYDFENAQNKVGSNYHLTAATPNSSYAAPVFLTDGIVGNAVSFNGSNALWNQTEYGARWSNTDKNLTISAWVRHSNSNTATYFTMFEMFESLFLRNNVFLGISRANGIFTGTTNALNIPAFQWVHVAAQYDQQENEVRLFINGVLSETLTGITGFHAYNDSFIVGAGVNSGTPNFAQKGFVGDIDEMYIFNRVLSLAEIGGMANLAPVVSPVPKFPVTFSASAGGTLTATVDGVAISSGDMVEEGKTITFTATPEVGYGIASWFDNGAALLGANTSITVSHNTPGTNRTVSFVVVVTSVRNARYQALSLYPNPARDMVRIVADSNIDRVEIYSLSGALQQSETGFGARNMNIQLANLNEGLYFVKTYTDEGLQTAKLQVKR